MNEKKRRNETWKRQVNDYRDQCGIPRKMNVFYQRNVILSGRIGIPRKTRKGLMDEGRFFAESKTVSVGYNGNSRIIQRGMAVF